MHDGGDPKGGKKPKTGFLKKGSLENSKTALDLGGGAFAALESTVTSNDMWLGKNGKYYSKSWGGNGATGSRAGAFKAANNYKWAGRATLGVSTAIGVMETYNGYQIDGGNFGYNAQSAAASSAGSIAGGWVGAKAGAMTFGVVGGMIGGPPGAVIGSVVGGFIGGFGGGYVGSSVGESSVNYYYNR